MTNYSTWKNTLKNVKSLTLDPENPRIPPSDSMKPEVALIEELAVHDDALEIAKSIAANGFFPSEPLIAIRGPSRFIVVEGNRRLAACKLLEDPELAPVALRQRFKTLAATTNLAFLKKLPVLVAPSRESTIPLMIARHTSNQLASWVPAMKAGFYARLVKSGISIEDVAKNFGIDGAEVRKSLREHHLYQMSCRLKLPAEAAAIVQNPREFPLTTLGRIFEDRSARAFFGVDFIESGRLQGNVLPIEFEKAFTKAVADVATGRVDSRTLNSANDIQTYLNTYSPEQTPDVTRRGTFDSDSFLAGAPTQAAKPAQKASKKLKKLRPPVGLIPRSFRCGAKNQRVRNLFDELQRLPPARFPNACAVAFRCFLEVSVYCYLDSKGEIATMSQEYKAEIAAHNTKLSKGKPPRAPEPNWTPTLSAMLRRLADPARALLPDPQVTKALGKVMHDEKQLLEFNLLAHNPAYHPSEQRLRGAWINLEEFFALILA